MNSISFQKRIPQAKCSIWDTQNQKQVAVTLCEYDCKNKSDSEKIRGARGFKHYQNIISAHMTCKHDNPSDLKDCKFYTLEDGNKIIGLMQCNINKDNLGVVLLESESKKEYKYIGTALLAGIATQLRRYGKNNLDIIRPVKAMLPFYIDKCGFRIKEIASGEALDGRACDKIRVLEMNSEEAKNLIRACEQKTKGKVINLIS